MDILPAVRHLQSLLPHLVSKNVLLESAKAIRLIRKGLPELPGANTPLMELISKVGGCAKRYALFTDFAIFMEAPYSLYTDMKDGWTALQNPGEQVSIREDRSGDFPSNNNPHIGVRTWVVWRCALSLCKGMLAALCVGAALKNLGLLNKAFSPAIQKWEKTLEVAVLILEIGDIEHSRHNNTIDKNCGNFPAARKISEQRDEHQQEHRSLLHTAQDCALASALLRGVILFVTSTQTLKGRVQAVCGALSAATIAVSVAQEHCLSSARKIEK